MLEIKRIIQTYDQLKNSELRLALATVVHVEDSSYRRSGARMLIQENGHWIGGISGGCLEGDTLLKAKYVILENKATVVRYDTRDDDPNQIGVGLGCNGLIDVLITPIDPIDPNNNIEKLRRIIHTRTGEILWTIVQSDYTDLPIGSLKHYQNEHDFNTFEHSSPFASSLLEDIQNTIALQSSRTVSYGDQNHSIKIFIEHITPSIRLMIYGKNYDTIPLAILARQIGWEVLIIANPLKLLKDIYQNVDKVVTPGQETDFIDDYTATVLMAHDYKTDLHNLKRLLSQTPSYIGILGPKKRSKKMFDELRSSQDTTIKNIYTPIGLDTGATTPEEIAIAILAEIRTHFSKRQGGFLKNRTIPIHNPG